MRVRFSVRTGVTPEPGHYSMLTAADDFLPVLAVAEAMLNSKVRPSRKRLLLCVSGICPPLNCVASACDSTQTANRLRGCVPLRRVCMRRSSSYTAARNRHVSGCCVASSRAPPLRLLSPPARWRP